MKKYSILACLLSSIFIISCATTAQQENKPQWIDNAKASYAENDYLTAVGQASKRDRASNNAKANLAEIFYVNVRSETNTITNASKEQSSIGITLESSTFLQHSLQTKTDQALSGVKIKESWLSPSGEYYALAVLDKRKAAMSLNESILELDESTATLINYSINIAPNQLASLNALREARDEQIARHLANLQLKQVSVSGIPVEISSKKIESLIAKKLATMNIAVNNDNSIDNKSVQYGLSQLGVNVVDESSLVIVAESDITEPSFINGWYWLRGSYQLSIFESGQVISRKRWPIKVSAKQDALLSPRLQDYINSEITGYLSELLSDSPTL